MNQKFKELADQCWDKHLHTEWPDAYYYVFDSKKFAELIVQECINKIETYHIPVGNSAAGELACEWTYDALKEIRDDIKEHFGLENDY